MNLVSKSEFDKLVEKTDKIIQQVHNESDNNLDEELNELLNTQKKLKKAFKTNRELLEKIRESNNKYKFYKNKLTNCLKIIKKQSNKINAFLFVVSIIDPMIEVVELQAIFI